MIPYSTKMCSLALVIQAETRFDLSHFRHWRLVHHVRAELSISQLSCVVLLFSRNLHDPALPLNVQTTSVRLLLNLVDFIFHSGGSEKANGKRLLVHIMKTMVAKFDTLRFHMIQINYSVQRPGCNMMCRQLNFSKCNSTTGRTESSPITTTSDSTPTDGMADVRPLIQTLIRGLKTVIWCISHYSQVKAQAHNLSEQGEQGGACESDTHANISQQRLLVFPFPPRGRNY